jgi:hypothetical protein
VGCFNLSTPTPTVPSIPIIASVMWPGTLYYRYTGARRLATAHFPRRLAAGQQPIRPTSLRQMGGSGDPAIQVRQGWISEDSQKAALRTEDRRTERRTDRLTYQLC